MTIFDIDLKIKHKKVVPPLMIGTTQQIYYSMYNVCCQHFFVILRVISLFRITERLKIYVILHIEYALQICYIKDAERNR